MDQKNLPVAWADKAMFHSEPAITDDDGTVRPKVYLLNMNTDPLGSIAAACLMYEGRVVRDLKEVTDEERRKYWEQVQRTHLKAPLEFVDMHFLFENVTRAFTHQLVRQRTAVFAQESMRFAVKDNLEAECPLPPSLAELDEDDPRREVWRTALTRTQNAYDFLIENGIPAEDARDLMPHGVPTRVHFKTNLRNLLDHAGNRLCTQAQFQWRMVFIEIMQAIADYRRPEWHDESPTADAQDEYWHETVGWQYELIAGIFQPVCYQLGHCPFQASFDRHCAIRDRVEDFAKAGVPSAEWGQGLSVPDGELSEFTIPAIDPAEWMMDHTSARVKGTGA